MYRKLMILPLILFIFLAGCTQQERAPQYGTIQFSSSPTGAQIYLDSQFRGSTPSTLTSIQPGNYTLEFRYPGYQSWSTVMLVSAGQNNVFAALSPETIVTGTTSGSAVAVPVPSSASQVSLTLGANRERMIIGESMTFSGTAQGCKKVILTMYGPGSYASGVGIADSDVDILDAWSYTWNPGSKIVSGTYTIVATDPDNKVTAKKEFQVIGGGQVTVVSNSYSAARGDTLRLSGLCTTGAPNIQLVLYGPGSFAGGTDLGTFSVQANKNWNFAYTLDNTMPTGVYTIYAYDVPKTTSGTAQFTVGYKN